MPGLARCTSKYSRKGKKKTKTKKKKRKKNITALEMDRVWDRRPENPKVRLHMWIPLLSLTTIFYYTDSSPLFPQHNHGTKTRFGCLRMTDNCGPSDHFNSCLPFPLSQGQMGVGPVIGSDGKYKNIRIPYLVPESIPRVPGTQIQACGPKLNAPPALRYLPSGMARLCTPATTPHNRRILLLSRYGRRVRIWTWF